MSHSPPAFFTPVPLKARHDGWTPELQRAFVIALARGASVDAAARRVGKSRATAYALRKRPGAASFAAAWDSALSFAKRTRIAAAHAPRAAAPVAGLRPATNVAEAEALLERLYPGLRRKAAETHEAGKADEADRG